MSFTNGHPNMIAMDESRRIDVDSIKLQYAEKFASFTPKARTPSTATLPTLHALPSGKPRNYRLSINPPLLNSSSPWSTDLEQLRALYASPYTGAVTTRTSLLEGFTHDPAIHQHVFFPAGRSAVHPSAPRNDASATTTFVSEESHISSLNTYGYSPHTLSEYLGLINDVVGQRHLGTSTLDKKPFIISVTGTPDEIAMSYALIANAAEMDEDLRLAMEVNLSCPNIDGKPPPAYDAVALSEFLEAVGDSKATYRGRMSEESVPRVGVKLPPYTWLVLVSWFLPIPPCLIAVHTFIHSHPPIYAAISHPSQPALHPTLPNHPASSSPRPQHTPPHPNQHHPLTNTTPPNRKGQFEMVLSALLTHKSSEPGEGSIIDFITCTNTLGSSLVLTDILTPALASEAGTGIGGLAGAALHPLALGNVATFRKMLDEHEDTQDILIIGVGGVEDQDGFSRMRKVGAEAVGLATALGRYGVGVFEKIAKGI